MDPWATVAVLFAGVIVGGGTVLQLLLHHGVTRRGRRAAKTLCVPRGRRYLEHEELNECRDGVAMLPRGKNPLGSISARPSRSRRWRY